MKRRTAANSLLAFRFDIMYNIVQRKREVIALDEEPQFHITVVSQRRRTHAPGQSHRDAAEGQTHPEAGASHRETASRGDSERKHNPQTNSGTAGSDRSADPSSRSGSGASSHRSSGSSSRHRHHAHRDYGTVNLGPLPDSREPNSGREFEAALPEEPSHGQLQREFMDKYAPALNRKYRNKEKSRLFHLLVIVVALILAGLIFSYLLYRQAHPKERDEIETVEEIPNVNPEDF